MAIELGGKENEWFMSAHFDLRKIAILENDQFSYCSTNADNWHPYTTSMYYYWM